MLTRDAIHVRYMAANDLMKEWEKQSDAAAKDQIGKIREAILRLLDDKSSDVSLIATKWCS